MASEIRDINNKIDHQLANSWYNIVESINPANVNYSTAQIVSVNEDMTTCDILMSDNTYVPAIPSLISSRELNNFGHLKVGDIVSIKHRGKHRDCEIVCRIQDPSVLISNSKDIETTGGTFNRGVYLV